jgi:hypothetical protein
LRGPDHSLALTFGMKESVWASQSRADLEGYEPAAEWK